MGGELDAEDVLKEHLTSLLSDEADASAVSGHDGGFESGWSLGSLGALGSGNGDAIATGEALRSRGSFGAVAPGGSAWAAWAGDSSFIGACLTGRPGGSGGATGAFLACFSAISGCSFERLAGRSGSPIGPIGTIGPGWAKRARWPIRGKIEIGFAAAADFASGFSVFDLETKGLRHAAGEGDEGLHGEQAPPTRERGLRLAGEGLHSMDYLIAEC
jgi:hypothetical protein